MSCQVQAKLVHAKGAGHGIPPPKTHNGCNGNQQRDTRLIVVMIDCGFCEGRAEFYNADNARVLFGERAETEYTVELRECNTTYHKQMAAVR